MRTKYFQHGWRALLTMMWLALVAAITPAVAQPSNDDFVDAQAFRYNGGAGNYMTSGYWYGNTTNSTDEYGEPYHHLQNWGGKSVWYYWIAPASGTATFTTAGSSFDTLLAAYTGTSLRALSKVTSNDDNGSSETSSISFYATAGRAYYLVVDGYNDTEESSEAESGYYRLNVTAPSASASQGPSNDYFSRAFALRAPSGAYGGSGYVRHSSVNATKESGEPFHAGSRGGKSVWYYWVAPASGTMTFSTIGSSFDTVLAVYTGRSVSGLSRVASDDDSGGSRTSRLSFYAYSGRAYYIAVDGYNATSGIFYLNLSLSRSSFSTSARATQPKVLSSGDADSAVSRVQLQFATALNADDASKAEKYKVEVNGAAIEVETAAYDAVTRSVTLQLTPGALQLGDRVGVRWNDIRTTQGQISSGEGGPYIAR